MLRISELHENGGAAAWTERSPVSAVAFFWRLSEHVVGRSTSRLTFAWGSGEASGTDPQALATQLETLPWSGANSGTIAADGALLFQLQFSPCEPNVIAWSGRQGVSLWPAVDATIETLRASGVEVTTDWRAT